MRRITTLALALAAVSLSATAQGQQPAQPKQAAQPTEHPERFGTTSAEDQLSLPACGTPRNDADNYYAPPLNPDQSRAPRSSGKQAYTIEVVAKTDRSWALAPLPNGDFLLSVRAGGMRIIDKAGKVSEPLANTPKIEQVALSAMYDIALDKGFARNRTLYFGYVTKAATGNAAIGRIASAKLAKDEKALEDVKVIYEAETFVPRRIVQAKDGTLLLTGGEVASNGPAMQSVESPRGKVLRINTDGSIPKDNPYLSDPKAIPALYAVGFRDQEAAALNPATGELWTAENEPRGGDELNLVRPGKNYGFPVISYGRENGGALINGGKTAQDGMEQPVYFWTPSIAPSGLLFYTGNPLKGWKNNLFLGGMSGEQLIRLEMKNGRVVAEEKLLRDRCKRIKDVRQGVDGLIYVITDETPAELLRIKPA